MSKPVKFDVREITVCVEVQFQIVDRAGGDPALINHTFANRAIAEQCATDLAKLVNG